MKHTVVNTNVTILGSCADIMHCNMHCAGYKLDWDWLRSTSNHFKHCLLDLIHLERVSG